MPCLHWSFIREMHLGETNEVGWGKMEATLGTASWCMGFQPHLHFGAGCCSLRLLCRCPGRLWARALLVSGPWACRGGPSWVECTFTMAEVALALRPSLDIPGGMRVGAMVEPSPILNLASTLFLHGAEPKWPSPSPVQPIQRRNYHPECDLSSFGRRPRP